MLNKEKADRILRKRGWDVTEAGCWEAHGSPNNSGYLGTTVDYKTYLLHRLAYLVWVGDIPEDHVILHICDVRRCINPQHLRVGTHQDNSDDAVRKNRTKSAEDHWNQQLAPTTVLEIYKAAKIGSMSQKDLGLFFGCSQMTVSLIKRKKRWRRFLQDAEDRGII